MFCKRCKKELKRQGRHTATSCLNRLANTAAFALPDPADSWARVELWRWQYGILPSADDMRPLEVSQGMVNLAENISHSNPHNVACVLRYAAKLISANTPAHAHEVSRGAVGSAGGES